MERNLWKSDDDAAERSEDIAISKAIPRPFKHLKIDELLKPYRAKLYKKDPQHHNPSKKVAFHFPVCPSLKPDVP